MYSFKPERKTTIVIIVIIFILILAYYLGLSRFTNKYLTFVTNPIVRSANYTAASLSDFFSLYLSRSDLDQKNQELSQKVIALAQKNIELELLRQENEFLKKELEFLDDADYQYLIAHVIGTGPDAAITDILINQGKSSGLEPGLPVTTNQGVIIGKLSQVEDNISHVKLLIDNQSKFSVIVAGQHTSLGLAHGQHNINIRIDMLPKDSQIELGDLITTSGLDQFIPVGLLIGSLSKIETSQEKLWQQGIVEPAVDYSAIRMVTIILPLTN